MKIELIKKSTWAVILLSFLATLALSMSFADAKSIKNKSLEFASDYFAYPVAIDVLRGQSIDKALSILCPRRTSIATG